MVFFFFRGGMFMSDQCWISCYEYHAMSIMLRVSCYEYHAIHATHSRMAGRRIIPGKNNDRIAIHFCFPWGLSSFCEWTYILYPWLTHFEAKQLPGMLQHGRFALNAGRRCSELRDARPQSTSTLDIGTDQPDPTPSPTVRLVTVITVIVLVTLTRSTLSVRVRVRDRQGRSFVSAACVFFWWRSSKSKPGGRKGQF